MEDLIGYIAACLTTLSFVPQAVKTIKTKDTSGISLTMYSMFLVGICMWLVYGLMIGSWPMILSNALTILLASIVLFYKVRDVMSASR